VTTREHTLLKFLHRNNTLLYDEGSAAELVDELHRRWAERSANDNGQEPVNNAAAKLNSISSSKAATNTVFLSYASEDRAEAMALAEAMQSCGIQVWFDVDKLQSGEQWKATVRKQIHACSLFVALISKHMDTTERRIFRYEWKEAIEEADTRPMHLPFIIPVAIDDTRHRAEYVPESFQTLHWCRLPGGRPSDEFLQEMKTQIRNFSRQSMRGF